MRLDSAAAGERLVFGGLATAGTVRKALENGAFVVTLFGHSDGIDASLGPELTLCANPQERGGPADRQPRCTLTGYCHRQGMTISEARDSGRLFAAASVRARVLILGVCSGVLFSQSLVDPRFGLLAALLSKADFGAVVTTYGIIISTAEPVDDLATMVLSGQSVGNALAALRQRPDIRDFGPRMVLIGDPRVRASSAVQSLLVKTPETRSIPSQSRLAPSEAWAGDRIEANTAFLRQLIGHRLEGAHARLDSAERSDILQRLMRRDTILSKDWLPLGDKPRLIGRPPCDHCGTRCDAFEIRFPKAGFAPRRVVICPICGIVEDMPTDVRLTFRLTGSAIEFRGDAPRTNWGGLLHFGSPNHADITALPWVAAGDGTPIRSWVLPRRLPIGPLRLSILFIWPEATAVAARFWRSPATPLPQPQA